MCHREPWWGSVRAWVDCLAQKMLLLPADAEHQQRAEDLAMVPPERRGTRTQEAEGL
jgi:hypothetical protein